DPLYSAVFNEYLFALFNRGYSVEYFIEGGRSRTGRLLPPRGGMLAMTTRSFLRGGTRPIAFVPVNISYEKVIEARTYLRELRGQSKQKETLYGLLRSVKTLRQSFGKVHVNFGKPLRLADFLDNAQPNWQFGDPRPPWLSEIVTQLGRTLAERINAAAVVNPVCLTALAILCTQRQAMDEESLGRFLELLVKLGRQGPNPPTLEFEHESGHDIIRYVESIGIIQREEHPLGDLLCVDGVNAILLTWYRNNIAHIYAYPSLIACFFVGRRRLTLEHLHRLCDTVYPHLRSELFLPWEPEQLHAVTQQWVDTLVDCAMLEREGDFYRAPPRYSHDYAPLMLLSQVTMQTLERFYIVVALLSSRPSQSITRDELEQWCYLTAQRMSRLHEIDAPEFFDRTLISNFIDGLHARHLIRENGQHKLLWDERFTEIIEEAERVIEPAFRETVMQGRVRVGPTDLPKRQRELAETAISREELTS
ncbi:MAG: 1-acyl-sn-glycerol-3-phosphate acyltransferase, partial [Pseudomonadales bacterium]